MLSRKVIRCVLSGSFHGDMTGMEKAYLELVTCGCQVLSPHRMQFIEKDSEFIRDEAEEHLEVSRIETHHLTSIRQADFLWIHVNNGYIGISTALEIGYAHASHVPIFAASSPKEEVLNQFVTKVPSVFEAIERLG